MVGDDGGANQIGMAPGARWIGCRNMDAGFGTPTTYTECFQWFMAPTDAQDLNPDPALAPDIINNSWVCPPSEGCTDVTILQTVVENVRAAGILVVVSAGNAGPACESVATPASIYDASFTVGATNLSDVIANFSGRGPVTVDGSMRMKPDISAPGVSIRSSIPNDGYGLKSGTSMAGPHVAGLAALLISANPLLAGNADALESAITSSAQPLTTTQGCGGDTATDVPNNTFGHGRIDALAAVLAVIANIPATAPIGLSITALLLASIGCWRLRRRTDARGLTSPVGDPSVRPR
jgi:subtilisin family serine protease